MRKTTNFYVTYLIATGKEQKDFRQGIHGKNYSFYHLFWIDFRVGHVCDGSRPFRGSASCTNLNFAKYIKSVIKTLDQNGERKRACPQRVRPGRFSRVSRKLTALEGAVRWVKEANDSLGQDSQFCISRGGNCWENPCYLLTTQTCQSCILTTVTPETRPSALDFKRYVAYFLQDNPSTWCAKGGHAAYGQAVTYDKPYKNDTSLARVGATYYQGYHTALKTSQDYYSALKAARELSANLTETINRYLREEGKNVTVNVFPYSEFYVFYEQYLTMWSNTLKYMGISMLSLFIVTFIFMGFDLLSALSQDKCSGVLVRNVIKIVFVPPQQ
ncbi:NPC intracellular cholesterol transporter 1 [Eumeta japonica]|uniref:NPC intracellular cholesterol transporter 1 n=1 Tax=Eumeta variegata TaxID=151549 RepID=A0A4C1U7R7_EUMVA|nr:NPC intracellular cholesterol transporter 1 [Eumeta japonica]